MKFNFLYFLFILFTYSNIFSYEVLIKGNKKLSIEDIQTFSDIDLSKKNLTLNEIDSLVNDLYLSELIYDLSLLYSKNIAEISIEESKIINEVFFNGNTFIKDDLLVQQISSSKGNLLNKKKLTNDTNIIKLTYLNNGYKDASININIEKFSNDRVNIIFSIDEGKPSKITKIDFKGNSFFSDSYLNKSIISEKISPLNFFSNSSNLNESIFQFDINKILNLYQRYGFFDVKLSYELIETGDNSFKLSYIIEENNRYKIADLKFNLTLFDISNNKIFKKLNKDLSKNDYFYDKLLFDKYINLLNEELRSKNINDFFISFSAKLESSNLIISFEEKKLDITSINKIDISGNSITKDKTLRSKLLFEPGDFYNQYFINKSKNNLLNLKYIQDVDIITTSQNNVSDITIDIEENKKTGNILFGGSLSGDTGFGIAFSIKDYNFLGSGNEINSSININAERYLFDISFTNYPHYNNKISSTYNIYNSEIDLTGSYGFKSRRYGLGYGVGFDYNNNIYISSKINLSNEKNFSQANSSLAIIDNIGEFNLLDLNFNITRDTTNDILYPTDGSYNSFSLKYSPENFSDDTFYKIAFKNNIFKTINENDNFVFISNNAGLAESLNGNLRTINTFSLGGNNFKGFDYKGVGPIINNTYLGGNKYFTSTIGYGDNFIFDESDNIIIKLFYTAGSIWDSDYSDDKFEIRSSLGVSLDFMTAIPVTLSYSIPVSKNVNDKTRSFNFFLGTSF